jgi:hypothetical protein
MGMTDAEVWDRDMLLSEAWEGDNPALSRAATRGAEAIEEVARLRPYVQHRPDCALLRGRHFHGVWLCEGESCTCGLDAARAALSSERKGR